MKSKTLFYQQKWDEAIAAAQIALNLLPESEAEITEFIEEINRCKVTTIYCVDTKYIEFSSTCNNRWI